MPPRGGSQRGGDPNERPGHPSHAEERELEKLSPFEFKSRLLRDRRRLGPTIVDTGARRGRGNPNWVATTPRGRLLPPGPVRADGVAPGVGGARPRRHAGAEAAWRRGCELPRRPWRCRRRRAAAADDRLRRVARLRRRRVRLRAGRRHHRRPVPGPDRICGHVEQILREYLADELLEGEPPPGDWDLFAVEGGTAAICYMFDSLATNLLLRPGDRIALMVPEFTPYLEIPRLDRYDLDVIELRRGPRSTTTAIPPGSSPTPRSTSSPTRGQGAVRGEPVEPAVGDARAGDACPDHRDRGRPATRN